MRTNIDYSPKGFVARNNDFQEGSASTGFSYFCKYDELPRVVACPGIEMSCVAESCYDPNYREEFKRRFGVEEEYF